MANLVTLSRLVMVLLVVWLARQPPSAWQFANFWLVALIFITDALDGYIARKRRETSLFGALFDIAGDRIAELTLWIVAAVLELVPIWVPVVFVVRGVIVDTIRSSQTQAFAMAPFSMMESPLGKWLVAGRFMRGFYAVAKACAFCGLIVLEPLRIVTPNIWDSIGVIWSSLTYSFVYLSVALCILRGLPVIAEFAAAHSSGRAQ
jgi:CDP-diacylglycerol--glycerol-3-phosphate 3-phosphatidyltransferase